MMHNAACSVVVVVDDDDDDDDDDTAVQSDYGSCSPPLLFGYDEMTSTKLMWLSYSSRWYYYYD